MALGLCSWQGTGPAAADPLVGIELVTCGFWGLGSFERWQLGNRAGLSTKAKKARALGVVVVFIKREKEGE